MKFPLALIFTINLLFLSACGGGSSSSGVDPTIAGENIPAIFVGVYKGTLNLTAEAISLTESDTFEITITVFEDGTIRFDGDEPDETFTAGITNDGDFAGNITITEDECNGTVGVTGRVDGTTATGTLEGDGECDISGLTVDVDLTGDFTATKQ